MKLRGIDLPVIFHSNSPNPEEMVREILEAESSYMTFYDIGAISPFYLGNGTEYSVIHSFGNNFIVPMTYQLLKQTLEE